MHAERQQFFWRGMCNVATARFINWLYTYESYIYFSIYLSAFVFVGCRFIYLILTTLYCIVYKTFPTRSNPPILSVLTCISGLVTVSLWSPAFLLVVITPQTRCLMSAGPIQKYSLPQLFLTHSTNSPLSPCLLVGFTPIVVSKLFARRCAGGTA